MSRVLVTGASGFIGSHLCRRLVEEGAEVHGVSRRRGHGKQIRWWQADLTDADQVSNLVEHIQPETIYHLAGYVSGSRALDAVLPSLQNNLVAAVNILVAGARSESGPIILAGSMEEPELMAGETRPCSPYAAAKHAAGSYARMFAALHGVPAVNLRVFMVYGPGQMDRTKLVPYVTSTLLRGESPELSSGVRLIDWVYVEDVVDAFVAAARKPELAGESIDIGSGELIGVRSIVDRIVEIMGMDIEPDFGAISDRPLETERAADVDRTRGLLDWDARTTLADGLRVTVDWYRTEFVDRRLREEAGS